MSSERSSLATQLRATAHDHEDRDAAALRARLRHKMFGVGSVPSAPPAPDVPVEPRFEVSPPRSSWAWLGWMVPCVATVAVAGMMAWHRRNPPEVPERAQPIRFAALVGPEPASGEHRSRARANDGPAQLDAAEREDDVAVRRVAEGLAVQASWVDAAAPRRIEATVRVASALRDAGEYRRAVLLLRTVLDDLELHSASASGRVRLLHELARAYEGLGRRRAAQATRTEAQRLGSG